MRKSLNQAFMLLVAVAAATLPGVLPAATYTFENLTPDAAIVGQDGWINASNTPANNPSKVEAGVGVNTSQVLRFQTSAQNSTHLHRQNDANFSFTPFTGSETNLLFEFDVYFVATTSEPSFSVIQFGQPLAAGSNVAPFFGYTTYSYPGSPGPSFMFRAARFGALSFTPIAGAAVANDWLRMRMELDLTANGGQGSANVFYKNLTNGDADYTPIAAFQNLNAGISGGVSSWDSLYVRFDGPNTEKRGDNLTVGLTMPQTVPGDFDSDGDIDGADFVAWQTHFPISSGASLADGDADDDDDVDGADFAIWQEQFTTVQSAGAPPVPEPATIYGAIAGGLLIFARWRQ